MIGYITYLSTIIENSLVELSVKAFLKPSKGGLLTFYTSPAIAPQMQVSRNHKFLLLLHGDIMP